MKVHCHVYVIESMVHLSIDTDSMENARRIALERSKQFTPRPADCSRIALCFPIEPDNDARLTRDTISEGPE